MSGARLTRCSCESYIGTKRTDVLVAARAERTRLAGIRTCIEEKYHLVIFILLCYTRGNVRVIWERNEARVDRPGRTGWSLCRAKKKEEERKDRILWNYLSDTVRSFCARVCPTTVGREKIKEFCIILFNVVFISTCVCYSSCDRLWTQVRTAEKKIPSTFSSLVTNVHAVFLKSFFSLSPLWVLRALTCCTRAVSKGFFILYSEIVFTKKKTHRKNVQGGKKVSLEKPTRIVTFGFRPRNVLTVFGNDDVSWSTGGSDFHHVHNVDKSLVSFENVHRCFDQNVTEVTCVFERKFHLNYRDLVRNNF